MPKALSLDFTHILYITILLLKAFQPHENIFISFPFTIFRCFGKNIHISFLKRILFLSGICSCIYLRCLY